MVHVGESVIQRIIKLRNLANNNTSEVEAARAAALMQSLLIENGLSMAELEAKANTTSGTQTFAKRTTGAHASSAMYQYQRDLMHSLCRNNFVDHWIEKRWKADPKGNKSRWMYEKGHIKDDRISESGLQMGRLVDTHMMLGREENVAATQVMYDYLTDTMDRLLPWQGMQKRGKDALLWLAGCTARLVERLDQKKWEHDQESRRKAKEQASQGGTGLIILSDLYTNEEELNYDARHGLEPGTTTRNRLAREAEAKRIRAEIDRLVATGVDRDDAYYIANGLTIPEKVPQIEESRADRQKRERREERERERWSQQRSRERDKESQRRNQPAYRQGNSTGASIGLDTQIDTTNRNQLT